MNYSRNIRKKAIGKRVMLSWVVTTVIGIIIGFVIGFAVFSIKASASFSDEFIEEFPEEVNDRADITIVIENPEIEPEVPEEIEEPEDAFIPLNVPLDVNVQKYLYDLCKEYNIEFTFAMAMIQQESDYKPNTISKTNDYGLMQINKCNHSSLQKALGITDFLDPYENIRAGMYILNYLFQKYGDPSKVLMAYNMGEEAAKRLWNKGTYSSAHSRAVLNIQRELEMMS